MTHLSADAALRDFLLQAISTAKDLVAECYRSATADSIGALLDSAARVLMNESAQEVICAQIDRSEHGARLLEFLSTSRFSGESVPAFTVDELRGIAIELLDLCTRAPSGAVSSALRRLALVLSLGQTDEHTIMASWVPDEPNNKPEVH